MNYNTPLFSEEKKNRKAVQEAKGCDFVCFPHELNTELQ